MNYSFGNGSVFASFHGTDILEENGRLVFAVLYPFAAAGYQVGLYRSIDLEALGADGSMMRGGRMILTIPGLRVVDGPPVDVSNTIYLFDRDDLDLGGRAWRRQLRVDYNLFSSHWLAKVTGRPPLILPYPMHPVHYRSDLPERLARLRRAERTVRVFFSGDIERYTKSYVTYPNEKLPRATVVEVALTDPRACGLPVSDAAGIAQVFGQEYTNRCAVVDMSRVRVRQEEWLEHVAKADFFLCPPGIRMPMCHNLTEAMAVGTIPIVSYPEWCRPALEHLENCLVFADRDNLAETIRQALEMDPQRIAAMRRQVVRYYEAVLEPRNFVEMLECRLERRSRLLVFTEKYVAQNARKLNARSIVLGESGYARGNAGLPPFPSSAKSAR